MDKLKELLLKVKRFFSRFEFDADAHPSSHIGASLLLDVCGRWTFWSLIINALIVGLCIVRTDVYIYVAFNLHLPFYRTYVFSINYEKKDRNSVQAEQLHSPD